MAQTLIPRRALFRFAAPCRRVKRLWTARGGAKLDESHRLPLLAELEGRTPIAEVRCGWNTSGLAFWAWVQGKQQPPWCREEQPEISDGLHVWLDTRDVHNVHRATRFCHRFALMPGGRGKKHEQPMAAWLPINRAKQDPRQVDDEVLKVMARRHGDGYELSAMIPAEALTGFDPSEHTRLGFQYAILDRELGEQTFAAGRPLPYAEDPSLWATLDLVE